MEVGHTTISGVVKSTVVVHSLYVDGDVYISLLEYWRSWQLLVMNNDIPLKATVCCRVFTILQEYPEMLFHLFAP